MSEEDFRSRLFTELAADEPPPPLGALVSAATMDGVKLRRRNRIVQMAAGTAGVTAVAFAATAVAGGIGPGPATTSAAAGGTTPAAAATTAPATPAAAAPAKPTSGPGSDKPTQTPLPRNWQTPPQWMAVPAPTAKPADGEPVTGQSAAKLLEELITGNAGPGTFSHVFGFVMNQSLLPASAVNPSYAADLYWNHGTVAVRYMPKAEYQMGCDPSENTNGNVCYDYKLADGTEVNYSHLLGQAGAAEIKAQKSQANLIVDRPDGSQILVLEVNGPESGSTGPDRADMPLTERQLYGIASDPRWADTMSAAFIGSAHSIQLAELPY